MTKEQLKRTLKKKLIDGLLGEVLQTLQEVFENNNESFNDLIVLSMENEQILKKYRAGTQHYEHLNVQNNDLNRRVISLIDTIRDEDAASYTLFKAHFDRILVICKLKERETEMHKLFPESQWINVIIDTPELPLSAEDLNAYELLVFDNNPFDTDEGQHKLLKYYLTTPGPCILYFGEYLKLLTEYPEKAYFANSVFSFHTRLQEMINYLQNVKTYQDNATTI